MAGAEVTIVSSDKDLMQLVGDGVRMYDAMKSRVIGPEEVKEKFCVGPEKVIDVQALAGDSTDNVPGVPGIGIKTAGKLIEEFRDLETLLARAGEIKQPKRRQSLIEHADAARMSKQLVTLHDDLTVPEPLASFAVRKPDLHSLRDFLEAQSFKTLISRLDTVLAKGGAPGAAEETLVQHEKYELVEDEEALRRWVAAAMTAGAVAIDTETTSLNALCCALVGVSLALERGRACYIPLGHRRPGGEGGLSLQQPGRTESLRQIPMATAFAILKPLLEDPSVLKIGQNIKFDMQVLARCGIHIAPFDDTMILSYVLESGLHGHGMDELAQHFLGIDTIKYSDVTGSGRSQICFDAVPVDKACAYAAEDADVTWRLHQVLKPRLVSEHLVSVYETIERPLIPVLAAMEQRGILVDADELKVLSGDFETRLDRLAEDIHRLAGHPFNIGSPKQLGDVLFVEMGLAGGKKMKTGAYATGADVLEALAAEGHDLPARVLDWRQLAKLKSTYTDALIGEINPETGRVHTSFAQAVAITGRLSSSDPNLQNIPIRSEEGRKIRRAFIADEGYVLLSADYSQIELRLLAHVAAIDALTDAFRTGIDIHALTASQVFGTPVEGMDPFVRRKAKAINFGIIYGISPFGLARQLGISRGEASAYIDAYFERYPGIRDYMERTREQARERGFVTTLFGRSCHLRGLTDRNPSVRSFAERLAINAPIQGGAADIIKRAMIRVASALRKAGLQTQMLLQVHDELLFEVPHDEVEPARQLVQRTMESAAVLDVPLVVDIGVGRSWADAH
jgi:DNA polymerase-1